MVWILRPPGVSTVRANNRRAASRSPIPGAAEPVPAMASRNGPSSSVAHRDRSLKTRIDMLAAAALVKGRHRMRDGGTPESSRRSTRCARTCVLPDPAMADTQADRPGSEARRWRSTVSAGGAKPMAGASDEAVIPLPRRRAHPWPTIP